MSLPAVVISGATAPAESVLDCPNRCSGEGKILTGVRNRRKGIKTRRGWRQAVDVQWITLHLMKIQSCGIRNPHEDVRGEEDVS